MQYTSTTAYSELSSSTNIAALPSRSNANLRKASGVEASFRGYIVGSQSQSRLLGFRKTIGGNLVVTVVVVTTVVVCVVGRSENRPTLGDCADLLLWGSSSLTRASPETEWNISTGGLAGLIEDLSTVTRCSYRLWKLYTCTRILGSDVLRTIVVRSSYYRRVSILRAGTSSRFKFISLII